MKSRLRSLLACVTAGLTLAGCAGAPVHLESANVIPARHGEVREISAQACGFQLLLFIPISINSRQQRAYAELKEKANGALITNIRVQESWYYAVVGTGYCTTLKATAVQKTAWQQPR